MGDLNNIQDEIMAEMLGDLADVSFSFTGVNKAPAEPYDPDNPEAMTVVNYSGTGIFGLAFNQRDSEIFQIQMNDQKAIIFMRSSNRVAEIGDDITYRDGVFKVIDINRIPADNGTVLQLRKV